MYTLLISVEQTQALLEDTTTPSLIFDVRHNLTDGEQGRRDYLEGHIPGAFHLDANRELSGIAGDQTGRHPLPSIRDFAAIMHAHTLTPSTQVVVYDSGNGMFAARLWWMLRWSGHRKVAVLDGGWSAWLRHEGAIERTASAVSSTEKPGQAHQGPAASTGMPTVTTDDLLRNLRQPVLTVIDARSAERFRGESEPIDPVAGHIPGALNRPSSYNLQADGRFKPASQLRSEFDALLLGVPAQKVVHQCGSGITACHNLLAMELAGLAGSALYPGSWSAWCSDAARPVTRGGT